MHTFFVLVVVVVLLPQSTNQLDLIFISMPSYILGYYRGLGGWFETTLYIFVFKMKYIQMFILIDNWYLPLSISFLYTGCLNVSTFSHQPNLIVFWYSLFFSHTSSILLLLVLSYFGWFEHYSQCCGINGLHFPMVYKINLGVLHSLIILPLPS